MTAEIACDAPSSLQLDITVIQDGREWRQRDSDHYEAVLSPFIYCLSQT